MNRIIINAVLLIFTFLTVILQAQPVAEISYVVAKGSAYLTAQPKIRLAKGQTLDSTATIVLQDGAAIRIFFPAFQQNQKYQAPDTIQLSQEIQLLKNHLIPKDSIQKLKNEISQLIRQYFKPEYNRYAGTRGAHIMKNTKIHDHILTFKQNPNLVLRTGGQPQTLRFYATMNDQKSNLLAEIPIATGNGVVVFTVNAVILNYHTTYFWDVSGETQSGTIKLVSAENAEKIEKTIRELKIDALDEVEAAESIAAYLFNQGFWAEAYFYVQSGLTIDPGNSVLKNLQQTILTLQPDDSAFQLTMQEKGELTLRYSFHIKKNTCLQEIYTGSTVHTGDMLQIRLEASVDCYLFILNIDAGKKLYVLYPLQNQDHFLKGGQEIIIPKSGKYFQADYELGEEKLLLIASKVPLDFLAMELDKYFAVPGSLEKDFTAMRGLADFRGLSTIVDEKGESVHHIKEGLETFKLSRLLKGKGLVVKEIVFKHVE